MMNAETTCAVSQAERAYQRQQSALEQLAAKREAAIKDRTEELLATDFCPWDQANFLEAMSEIDLVGNEGKDIVAFCRAINNGNHEAIGQLVSAKVFAYCEGLAREQATREVQLNREAA